MATLEEMRLLAQQQAGAATAPTEPTPPTPSPFGQAMPTPTPAPFGDTSQPIAEPTRPPRLTNTHPTRLTTREILEEYGIVPAAMTAGALLLAPETGGASLMGLGAEALGAGIGGFLGQGAVELERGATGEYRPGGEGRMIKSGVIGAASVPVTALFSAGVRAAGRALTAAADKPVIEAATRDLQSVFDNEQRRLRALRPDIQAAAEKSTRDEVARQQADQWAATLGDRRTEILRRRAAIEAPGIAGADARQAGTKGLLQDLYQQVYRPLGDAYEKLAEGHLDTLLPQEAERALGAQAQTILDSSRAQQSLRGPVAQRLTKLAEYATDPAMVAAEQEVGQLGLGPEARQAAIEARAAQLRQMPDFNRPPLTVADVLQFKRDLAPYLDNAFGSTRTAARLGIRTATDTLHDLIPSDPQLNSMYADFRDRFPWQRVRDLHHGAQVEDYEAFFQGRPLRALVDKATPVQRAQLQDSLSEYLLWKHKGAPDTVSLGGLMSPDTFEAVMGKQRAMRLFVSDAKADDFAKMLTELPGMEELFKQAKANAFRAEWDTTAARIKSALVDFWKSTRQPGLDRIEALSDQDAARLYLRQFRRGLSPQQQLEMRGQMGPPSDQVFGPRRLKFMLGMGAAEMLAGNIGTFVKAGVAMTGITAIKRGIQRLLLHGLASPTIENLTARILSEPMTVAHVKMLGRLVGRVAVADAMRATDDVMTTQPQNATDAFPGSALPAPGTSTPFVSPREARAARIRAKLNAQPETATPTPWWQAGQGTP